jgi:3'-5' exoribonuclease
MTKYTEESSARCIEELKRLAVTFRVKELAGYVLDNEKFRYWSASAERHQHHHGDYGLVHHTHEVVTSFLAIAEFYPQYEIDKRALFLAALFHDFGKTEDYEKVGERVVTKGTLTTFHPPFWRGTLHKRRIHHITESVMAWDRAMQGNRQALETLLSADQGEEDMTVIFDNLHESVTHAILSHHGRRDWGSPVAPNTREAWILHLCDGISARLCDCDTLDRLS